MREMTLNKYKTVWMLVFFDLPVGTSDSRKNAGDFRKFLQNSGFSMMQYSVYGKPLSGLDACEKYYGMIEGNTPPDGKVEILTITDRQYENIRTFRGKSKVKERNMGRQLLLF